MQRQPTTSESGGNMNVLWWELFILQTEKREDIHLGLLWRSEPESSSVAAKCADNYTMPYFGLSNISIRSNGGLTGVRTFKYSKNVES